MSNIRNRTDSILKEKRLTKRWLASEIGISEGNLNRVLSNVSLDYLQKISIALNVNINELLDDNDDNYSNMNNSVEDKEDDTQDNLSSFLMQQIADRDKKLEEKEKEINSLNRYIGKLEALLEQNGLDYTGIYENVKKGVV